MQRVNGSLGSLLNNAYVCSVAPDEKDGSDWYLRWKNATLTQVREGTAEPWAQIWDKNVLHLSSGVDRVQC